MPILTVQNSYVKLHQIFQGKYLRSVTKIWRFITSVFIYIFTLCHRSSRRQTSRMPLFRTFVVGVIRCSAEGRLPVALDCVNDGPPTPYVTL